MNIHARKITPLRNAAGLGAAKPPIVLALRGWVCDRYTASAMRGAALLARAAAARLSPPVSNFGCPGPATNLSWRESLDKATPYLRDVACHVDRLMSRHRLPIIFANRCGASLATIAAMLRRRRDAKIVWFDAHGDFNTPESSPTGYLGGMVLAALCGLWDSGFGAGLSPDRIILAGTRDLDPGECRLIAAHGVKVIAAKDGAVVAAQVIDSIGGTPVWLHIDTDVVDPAYLPAEYRVDHGLRPSALHAMLRGIVRASEIVGFELTEFEAPKDPRKRGRAVRTVMRMIGPVLAACKYQRHAPPSCLYGVPGQEDLGCLAGHWRVRLILAVQLLCSSTDVSSSLAQFLKRPERSLDQNWAQAAAAGGAKSARLGRAGRPVLPA
ncbi:MAG: arginase family protein [Beijerinckiaceae bacterium]|nr:arginase family protein [Beijerinckiaceae bacterium]MCI0736200.1 arginase family protein [Beijerinckiaceae bacterium]